MRATARGIFAALLAVVALAVTALPVRAMEMLPDRSQLLRQLSSGADLIVLGEVVSARGVELPDSSSHPRDEMRIRTESRVRMREVWNADSGTGDTISVWRRGGYVEGKMAWGVEGEAGLQSGKRYVLFLKRISGGFRVMSGEQGALQIEHDSVNGYLTGKPQSVRKFHSRVQSEIRKLQKESKSSAKP